MPGAFARFGLLLTEGIHRISIYQNRAIQAVQDDLGYAIGRETGGSAIEYWRKGHVPHDPSDLEKLAREIIKQGKLGREWLEQFLASADYLDRERLCDELFPPRPPAADAGQAGQKRDQDGAPVCGSAPLYPALIIGRERDIADLSVRLNVALAGGQAAAPVQALTAVHGWPGVGKTTLAAALAHAPGIERAFPDGILWASLGQSPDLLAELGGWARALGMADFSPDCIPEEISAQLAAVLRDQRRLLIVDDVWEAHQAVPFRVGGRGCAMLVTTRLPPVAQALAPTSHDVYHLGVLPEQQGLELLRQLAPNVVAQHSEDCRKLVRELEGLPLALQVAGRLLDVEASYGWAVQDLLAEIQNGARLLAAEPPPDLAAWVDQTPLTVAVLLKKSTNHLDPVTRDCFAYLGVFAPKPASFDLEVMKDIWEVPDPKPIVRQLTARGLLEPIGGGRFTMHALLVMLARSLLTEASDAQPS